MKQELFPTNITPEEKAAGFLLVKTCIPHYTYTTPAGTPNITVAAVLHLVPEKNVRLIKIRNPIQELSEGDIDYQLEIFGPDASLEGRPGFDPQWHSAWDGLSLGLDQTIARFKREGVPPDWLLRQAPEERIVSPNECD
jgi:hypothetical protein